MSGALTPIVNTKPPVLIHHIGAPFSRKRKGIKISQPHAKRMLDGARNLFN